jgi:hypothetical protein
MDKIGEYARLVPKDFAANVFFRRAVLRAAEHDPAVQACQMELCRRDPLYWFNAFGWTFNPKLPATERRVRPFITWPYQDEFITNQVRAIGLRNAAVSKSRQMGISCCGMGAYAWAYIFGEDLNFLALSRKEELVDNGKDPKSLFFKIRFMLKFCPGWMRPASAGNAYFDCSMRMVNPATNVSIIGESTNGDMGRGGSWSQIFRDEWAAVPENEARQGDAAVADSTDSVITVSTYRGPAGSFYDLMHNDEVNRATYHWSLHPEKKAGLYTSHEGRLEILDKDYQFPKDYGFVLDGKLRSPYYDRRCREIKDPAIIAQELDCDPIGSGGGRFFGENEVARIQRTTERAPFAIGNFDLHREEFQPDPNGLLQLWLPLDVTNRPPPGRQYVLGADIGQGTGASNSALEVFDAQTCEEVAALATPWMLAEDFSQLAYGIGMWFNRAKVIWDGTGPTGSIFTKCITEMSYPNLWTAPDEKKIQAGRRQIAGFWMGGGQRTQLFTMLRSGLIADEVKLHNRALIEELRMYVQTGEAIEHIRSKLLKNQQDSKLAHGDRVVAAGVAWQVLDRSVRVHRWDDYLPENPNDLSKALPGTVGWDQLQLRRQQARERNQGRLGWREHARVA